MLNETLLIDLLQAPNFSMMDKILCCLAAENGQPKLVREVRETALKSGLRKAEDLNISAYLGRAWDKGLVAKTGRKWRLTTAGRQRVYEILENSDVAFAPPQEVATRLREELQRISNTTTAAFVEEAIKCYEYLLYRSSVVLSWVGAVAVLYDYVLSEPNRLQSFNSEAHRRYARWKNATTKDDLARMKESDFLDILESISVIGKNTKQQLKECLRLRNACGHPSTLQIGQHRVAAHLEILIMNVYSKFV